MIFNIFLWRFAVVSNFIAIVDEEHVIERITLRKEINYKIVLIAFGR